jgi:hypothetical protein
LQDSFWYYGTWYKPGDKIYISADGWVSFDPAAAPGVPTPPLATIPFPFSDEPNAIIAVLWQDNNPTYTFEPRYGADYVYRLYDASSHTEIIEWYKMMSSTMPSNVYTYELQLSMGGQDKLIQEGTCGVVFSHHFIHFLYDTCSNHWYSDNGRAGFENQNGTAGIWYQGIISDGLVARAGYKKLFKHDVAAYEILQPRDMVLRWTYIEPKFIVANAGTEAEHFAVFFGIYDEDDVQVYSQNCGSYDLLPGKQDTLSAPCWTPHEIGTTYEMRLLVSMVEDLCRHNDTLIRYCSVHCDDTLRYLWNFGDWSDESDIIGTRLGSFYAVDSGVLLTGGRVYLPSVI